MKFRTKANKKSGGKSTKAAIALGIPVALIVLLIVLAYLPRGPDIYPLPSQIPFKEQPWMAYVPTDSTLVKFYNFSRIVASPGAQYAIQNSTLIYVYDSNYKVNVDQVSYSFEVAFGSAVVDVFVLKPVAFQAFLANARATLPSSDIGGYTFYIYRENAATAARVHAVFRDGLIFESSGGPSASQTVLKVLKNHDENLTSFFSTPERHSEYYLATSTESEMLGFSVIPDTTLAGTHEWVNVVYDATKTIDLVNFYAYKTQQNATQMYSTALSQILTPNFARSYIVGNFIAQTRSFAWKEARTPMNSL